MKPEKKQNIAIVVREYEVDGEKKKAYRTIGELITWEGGRQSIDWYTLPAAKIAVFDKREDNG